MENNTNTNTSLIDIQQLQKEITQLKTEMDHKLNQLETKLEKVLKSKEQTISKPQKTSIEKKHTVVATNKDKTKQIIKPIKQQVSKKEKSKVDIYIELILSLLPNLISKLVDFINPLKKIYTHYKQEDKLTEFFMIVFGIIAFVVGFGYLLQYSFSNIFSPITKITISFILVNLLYLVAKKIYTNNTFKEYSTALMGLTITLNYLITYFIISYYELLTINMGMLLIILNISWALYLSHRYDSIIVAFIGYLGAILTPFLIDLEIYSHAGYMFYLFLVTLPTLIVFKKNQTFKIITFLSFIVISELNVYFDITSNLTMILSLHLFLYLYLYIGLFEQKLQAKSSLNKIDITIIVTNIINFIYIIFETNSSDTLLPVIYGINFLLLTSMAYSKLEINNLQKSIFIVLASIFLAFTILFLFGFELSGIIWSIEALLLLYLGYTYQVPLIRKEAYVLYVIALLSLLKALFNLFNFNEIHLYSQFFIQLIALGMASYALLYLIKRFKQESQPYEIKIFTYLNEIISIWQLSFITLAGYAILNHYIFLLIPYLSFYFFYKGETLKLNITKILAFISILIGFIEYYISIMDTGTIRFIYQTLSAKIALIQLFAFLWILQYFYEKYLPEGSLLELIQKIRILFYFLLPIIYLPSIYQYYNEYLPFALYSSILISFFINEKVNHEILKNQLIFLFFASLIYFIFYYYTTQNIYSLIALGILALWSFALIYYKNMLEPEIYKNTPFKHIVDNSYLVLVIGGSFILYHLLHEISFVLKIASIFMLWFLSLKEKNIIIQQKYELYYNLSIVLIPIFIYYDLTHTSNTLLLLISTLIYLIAFYILALDSKSYNLYYNRYIFHSIIVIFYSSICILYDQLFFISILMISHALVCLYLNKKELPYFYKALFIVSFFKIVLIDTASFSLVEKMMIFSIIGAILIISAYLFIKKNENIKGEKNV